MPGAVFRQFLGDLRRMRFGSHGVDIGRLDRMLERVSVRNYEAIPQAPASNACCRGI
jgi:hypothetical protein